MSLFRRCVLVCLALLVSLLPVKMLGQTNFTTVVVFGDSLSDTGNIAHLTQSQFGLRFPGDNKLLGFDYTDGRFTDGTDTQPAASTAYSGVWIEQLVKLFGANVTVKDSLDGGTDYAYGDATTGSGTTTETKSYIGINLSITLDNMGQQVTTYLGTNPTPNAQTLYVLWGGANDLLNAAEAGQDPIAAAQTAAANELGLVQQLMAAGGTNFLIPNLPPLGAFAASEGPAAVTALNTASGVFAQALTTGIAQLQQAAMGKTLNVHQADVLTLFGEVDANPMSFGLGNITSAAQNISASPDTYLIWDGLHPTTTGHNFVAQRAAALFAPLSVTSTAVTVPGSSLAGQTLTVSAMVIPGTSGGVPSGLVTFYDGTAVVASGPLNSKGVVQVTFTPTESAGGAVALSAVYAGDIADNQSVVTTTIPLLSAPIGTTVAVTASASAVNAGSAVTFTATVTPAVTTYGTPAGTVTFLDGGTTLGTGTLNGNGVATYTASSLGTGPHSITATYAGGGVFSGSTSAVFTETVTAPGFTAQANPTSLTIASGGSGTTSLSVTLTGGYTGTVTPACGTLPAHFSCSIAVQETQTTAGTTAYTLTIATNAAATTSAVATPMGRPGAWRGERVWTAGLLLPGTLGLMGFGLRRRRKGMRGLLSASVVVLLCAGLLGVAGCGGGSSNNVAPGSYTVPVVFTPSVTTGGVAAQTVNIAVTVQ